MEFKRTRKRHRGLDLTPLIDVVFLLIVFLILTTNAHQPTLSLDLPGGVSEDEANERVVQVELDANGNLALDGEPCSLDELREALQVALEPQSERAVRLYADEHVEYGELLPVIEQIRAAGASAIDMVHEVGGQ